jgi:hypothetical protein
MKSIIFFAGTFFLLIIPFSGKAQNPDPEWKDNFAYIGDFHGDCAIFRAKESEGGDLGLVNRSGKIILQPEYREMTWKTPTLVEVIKSYPSGSKSGLFNQLGQRLFEDKLESIGNFSRGIAIITADNYLKGIINEEGKLIVPIIYTYIEQNEKQPYLVLKWRNSDETENAIYSDTLGNKIGKKVFEDAELFEFGVGVVKVKGQFGLVDQQFQFLIPPKFSGIYYLQKGLLKVEKMEKFGIRNMEGKEIIPCQYHALDIIDQNRFRATKNNGKVGILNGQNHWTIPPIYDGCGVLEGMKADKVAYLVAKDEKMGVIGSSGQILVPLEYSEILEADYDPTHYYGLLVKKDDKWGLINRDGKEVTPPIYDAFSYDFDGHGTCQLVLVQKNGLWGCLDTKTGKEVVTTDYSSLRFIASKEEKEDSTIIFHIYHFKGGKEIVLDTVYSYDNMFQRVQTGLWEVLQEKENENGQVFFVLKGAKEWKILNRSGQVIYERPFSNVLMYFNEGLLPFEQNGRWGFLDSLGNETIAPQFETSSGEIQEYFSGGKAWVKKDGNWYYINFKGEKIEIEEE